MNLIKEVLIENFPACPTFEKAVDPDQLAISEGASFVIWKYIQFSILHCFNL